MQPTETTFQFGTSTVTASRDGSRIRPRTNNPRAFVFIDGETIMEQLFTRHQRPRDLWRHYVQAALVALGGDPDRIRLRWSQKAGCSCPCSPGFILQDDGGADGHGDLSIKVTDPNPDDLKVDWTAGADADTATFDEPRKTTTHHFPSSSTDRVYDTVEWDDGSITCNCPGWIYKRGDNDRTCKHVTQVRTGSLT